MIHSAEPEGAVKGSGSTARIPWEQSLGQPAKPWDLVCVSMGRDKRH